MLKNFGFFALGIIAAAAVIWAFKKMSKKETATDETADNTTDTGGGGMGGSMSGGVNQTGTGGN